MTREVSAGIASNGSFSASLSDLQPFTTYYYKALVKETATSGYKYGSVRSFTTDASGSYSVSSSLELPGSAGNADKVLTVKKASNSSETNYTFNYSYTRYASLWTAYSLTASDVLDTRASSDWKYYPTSVIPAAYQVSVTGNSYPSNYPNTDFSLSEGNLFARGHQIPAGDRKNDDDKAQTYYVTNQTPQIQNRFNQGIWQNLEDAGRAFVTGSEENFRQTDVLYIVTGPCYQKTGGSEKVYTLKSDSASVTPNEVPIPNYYWKAFLKVRKNSSGNIVSAMAIGFWFDHKEYNSGSYTDSEHIVSVDQIESWTGFDLFANLPDSIEPGVESNSTWIAFRDF